MMKRLISNCKINHPELCPSDLELPLVEEKARLRRAFVQFLVEKAKKMLGQNIRFSSVIRSELLTLLGLRRSGR
jgi:hypothetical protein